MHAAQPVPGATHANAAVPAHDALIRDRVEPLPSQKTAHERVLRADVLRAPEPVGVPAPQVIAGAQKVGRALADRPVIEVQVRVIAGVRGGVGKAAEREVELVRRERGAVQKIEPAFGAVPGDVGKAGLGAAVTNMLERHIRLDRGERGGDRERVAQRPVRIRKAVEEVAVLVVGRAGDDPAVAGQHVERDDRVVDETAPERRRLDAHAGDRAAQRNRLQLRHHGRHRPLRERRVDEVDVADHALGLDGARRRVDRDDLIEMGEIDRVPAPRRAVAKQVRRRLGDADAGRAAGGAGRAGEVRGEAGELVGVGGHWNTFVLRTPVFALGTARRAHARGFSRLADTGTTGSSDNGCRHCPC